MGSLAHTLQYPSNRGCYHSCWHKSKDYNRGQRTQVLHPLFLGTNKYQLFRYNQKIDDLRSLISYRCCIYHFNYNAHNIKFLMYQYQWNTMNLDNSVYYNHLHATHYCMSNDSYYISHYPNILFSFLSFYLYNLLHKIRLTKSILYLNASHHV